MKYFVMMTAAIAFGCMSTMEPDPDPCPEAEPVDLCQEHVDCDDFDPCTRDMCVINPYGNFCSSRFVTDVEIWSVDSGEDGVVQLHGSYDQELIRFYVDLRGCSGPFSFRALRVNIGADCSGDGQLESESFSQTYLESGGSCGRAILPERGLYDESDGEPLIRNIRIKDLETDEVIAGPLELADYRPDPLVDGFQYVNVTDTRFGGTSCPSVEGYAVIADVFTQDKIQVNVQPLQITSLPECYGELKMIEGAPRQIVD